MPFSISLIINRGVSNTRASKLYTNEVIPLWYRVVSVFQMLPLRHFSQCLLLPSPQSVNTQIEIYAKCDVLRKKRHERECNGGAK